MRAALGGRHSSAKRLRGSVRRVRPQQPEVMGEDPGGSWDSGPAAGRNVQVQAISVGDAELLRGGKAPPGREVADDDFIAVDGPVAGQAVRGI